MTCSVFGHSIVLRRQEALLAYQEIDLFEMVSVV